LECGEALVSGVDCVDGKDHSRFAVVCLLAVSPDRGGAVHSDAELRELRGVGRNRLEARVKSSASASGWRKRHARCGERRLCDGVVLGNELENNDVIDCRRDFVGAERECAVRTNDDGVRCSGSGSCRGSSDGSSRGRATVRATISTRTARCSSLQARADCQRSVLEGREGVVGTVSTTVDSEDHSLTTVARGGVGSLGTVHPDGLSVIHSDSVRREVVSLVGRHGHVARVEATILETAGVRKRRLGGSVVLLLEVEHDLIAWYSGDCLGSVREVSSGATDGDIVDGTSEDDGCQNETKREDHG